MLFYNELELFIYSSLRSRPLKENWREWIKSELVTRVGIWVRTRVRIRIRIPNHEVTHLLFKNLCDWLCDRFLPASRANPSDNPNPNPNPNPLAHRAKRSARAEGQSGREY